MNYNTQNAKIASITEKTLIVGIDVRSETHFARAFDWRNYEYSKKPLEFSNSESGFETFKAWVENIAEEHKECIFNCNKRFKNLWLQFFLSQNQGFMRLFEKTVLK